VTVVFARREVDAVGEELGGGIAVVEATTVSSAWTSSRLATSS